MSDVCEPPAGLGVIQVICNELQHNPAVQLCLYQDLFRGALSYKAACADAPGTIQQTQGSASLADGSATLSSPVPDSNATVDYGIQTQLTTSEQSSNFHDNILFTEASVFSGMNKSNPTFSSKQERSLPININKRVIDDDVPTGITRAVNRRKVAGFPETYSQRSNSLVRAQHYLESANTFRPSNAGDTSVADEVSAVSSYQYEIVDPDTDPAVSHAADNYPTPSSLTLDDDNGDYNSDRLAILYEHSCPLPHLGLDAKVKEDKLTRSYIATLPALSDNAIEEREADEPSNSIDGLPRDGTEALEPINDVHESVHDIDVAGTGSDQPFPDFLLDEFVTSSAGYDKAGDAPESAVCHAAGQRNVTNVSGNHSGLKSAPAARARMHSQMYCHPTDKSDDLRRSIVGPTKWLKTVRLIKYFEKNDFVTQLKDSRKEIFRCLQRNDAIFARFFPIGEANDSGSSPMALMKLQKRLRTTQILNWLNLIAQRLDLVRYYSLYDRAVLSVQDALDRDVVENDDFLRWTATRLRDLKQTVRVRRGGGIGAASIVKERLVQLHLAELGDSHMTKKEMFKHVTWCRNQGQFWSELVQNFHEEIVWLGLSYPGSKIPSKAAREQLVLDIQKRSLEFRDTLTVACSFLEDVRRKHATRRDRC